VYTVDCECFFTVDCTVWWGHVMRLHLAGSKRQAGGAPTGLRIPDAWLSCLCAGQTPAHMWRLGCCLCARHTPAHIWRLGCLTLCLKEEEG
jgi:hypothetical protein